MAYTDELFRVVDEYFMEIIMPYGRTNAEAGGYLKKFKPFQKKNYDSYLQRFEKHKEEAEALTMANIAMPEEDTLAQELKEKFAQSQKTFVTLCERNVKFYDLQNRRAQRKRVTSEELKEIFVALQAILNSAMRDVTLLEDAYKELNPADIAYYDGCVYVDLSTVKPMIALPFHPSNAYPVAEVVRHADELFAAVEEEARKQFGKAGEGLQLRAKIHDGGVWVDQGIIAGCAGGSFENCCMAASILDGRSTGCGEFSLSVYPASEPQAIALVRNGAAAKLMAAGAVIKNAFCGVRPPGHHAARAEARGFCYLNNVAIGAYWAMRRHGARRVAIVDFDAHHGDGTEEIVANHPDIRFMSLFQWPLYPHRMMEPTPKNVVVSPVAAGADGAVFTDILENVWLPQLEAFRPDIIFVSAGFDAHVEEQMAQLKVKELDYARITRRLLDAADVLCEGRLVSVLEGGYAVRSLARSVMAHLNMLVMRGRTAR